MPGLKYKCAFCGEGIVKAKERVTLYGTGREACINCARSKLSELLNRREEKVQPQEIYVAWIDYAEASSMTLLGQVLKGTVPEQVATGEMWDENIVVDTLQRFIERMIYSKSGAC